MSDLKTGIMDAVKNAMRAGDKPRLGTLRMISAAIKQKEVDERRTLDDADVLAILDKMVKQRRESVAQYEQAGRQDLADAERRKSRSLTSSCPSPSAMTKSMPWWRKPFRQAVPSPFATWARPWPC